DEAAKMQLIYQMLKARFIAGVNTQPAVATQLLASAKQEENGRAVSADPVLADALASAEAFRPKRASRRKHTRPMEAQRTKDLQDSIVVAKATETHASQEDGVPSEAAPSAPLTESSQDNRQDSVGAGVASSNGTTLLSGPGAQRAEITV